jgi:hypothetical protein
LEILLIVKKYTIIVVIEAVKNVEKRATLMIKNLKLDSELSSFSKVERTRFEAKFDFGVVEIFTGQKILQMLQISLGHELLI